MNAVIASAAWTHSDTLDLLVAAGTLGLAGLTAILAWKTRDMAKATDRMVTVTRDAISAEDVRLDRTFALQEELASRQRSHDAAAALLDAIAASGIEPGTTDLQQILTGAAHLRRVGWSRIDLLADTAVKLRVQVCLAMLQFLRWQPENLARDGLTLEEVAILVPEVIQMTELALQAHITGATLPHTDHPTSADNNSVANWIDLRHRRPPGANVPGGPAEVHPHVHGPPVLGWIDQRLGRPLPETEP